MIPTDDIVAHEHSPECVCGPVRVPIVTGEGDTFSLTIHHRLDETFGPTEPSRSELTR